MVKKSLSNGLIHSGAAISIKTAIADLHEKQEAMGKWQPQK